MPDDRDLHWTWLVAGAVAVLVTAAFSTKRGRFWIADRLIDLGIWMQTDEEVEAVERSLADRGRHERSQAERKASRRNGHAGSQHG